MSRDRNNIPDPDDMFADSRMTFGEHIEDLRTHLLRAIYGFVLCLFLGFVVAKPVLRFIASPVERVLAEYYEEMYNEKSKEILEANKDKKKTLYMPLLVDPEVLKQALHGVKPEVPKPQENDDGTGHEIDESKMVTIHFYVPDAMQDTLTRLKLQSIIRPPTLTTLSVQEAFVVYVKVALLTGLVLSSPWVFWQIWSFIAAGLYPHEKKLVHFFMPLSIFLFLGGVFICEFFVIPKAVEALLWFNKFLGLQPDLRLSEWLGFAIMMPLVFGLSFQTPLVMLFIERIGVVEVKTFRAKRRLAIFLMGVFSAVITPTVDIFSMLLLLIPMCLLYELGILLCVLNPRSKFLESETEDSEDLIEV